MEGLTLLLLVAAIIAAGTIWIVAQGRRNSHNTSSPVTSVDAELSGVQGPHQGKNFPVRPPTSQHKPLTIGRSADNWLVIPIDLVSRLHAQIVLDGSQILLYDMGSINGTWVNGQRIAQHLLKPGDHIQIGPSTFLFKQNSQVTPPATGTNYQPTPVPADAREANLQDYQLIQELGGGGAAVVFKAQSKKSGQIVAIKFLMRSDPYLRQKFQGEIRLGQTLHHPLIARIYGGGISAEHKPYFVMEFVDGSTLRDWLNSQKRMAPDQVISIIGQACDALQYAHGLGIYHRDIKPENIMLTRQRQLKLIDFGIARVASQTTHTADGVIVGTPFYLSYEQAKGHSVDGRSDIYSLGVVLYELLTGRVPFYSPDPLEVVHLHVSKTPVAPRKINPDIPLQLEQVTLRCLEKNNQQRFQSPAELAAAIGYNSKPIGSTSDSMASRAKGIAQVVNSATGRALSITGTMTELCRRDINPNDHSISRTHASIIYHNGRYWLKDQSANGTFLNGVRIDQPALLHSGDQIQIGHTSLRFETG